MFLIPIVIACSVGFLSTMYKIAEKQKLDENRQVSVVIDGLEHSLRQPSTNENLGIFFHDWSTQFCSKEGLKLGFDSDSLHLCTESIVSSLFNRMNEIDIYKEKLIELKPWSSASMNSTVESGLETTETNQNQQIQDGKHLYIADNEILETNDFSEQLVDAPTTNSSDSGSINSSTGDVRSSSSSINNPQVLKLPLEINDITYIFEYIATGDETERNHVAYQLAQSFCQLHGDVLVNQHIALTSMLAMDDETEEMFHQRREVIASQLLQEQCIDPIQGALLANMAYYN